VGCKRVRGTAKTHDFIEGRNEMISAQRRLKSSDKEAVVAARHACGDGSRSKTADAVGDKPLTGFGRG
jgi:hypothetical protein